MKLFVTKAHRDGVAFCVADDLEQAINKIFNSAPNDWNRDWLETDGNVEEHPLTAVIDRMS